MKKYIFVVEVEAPDDIEWSAKGWEASLNVAYSSSGKFKVTAQQSVQADTCPKCLGVGFNTKSYAEQRICETCNGTGKCR